jgi:beta-glucosidase
MTALPYLDPRRSPEERTEDLLARMTLPEKLAQLAAVWCRDVSDGGRFSAEKAELALTNGAGQVTRIGATTVLTPDAVARLVNEIQTYLRIKTRLGIPAVVHEESCAGLVAKGATQFPQAIGLAATFEPDLAYQMTVAIRRQMLAVGARQSLAPVLDVARDPRWGRVEETFGEDPYLAARMGVAYVRGLQGDSLADGIVATAKHFVGYGAPEGGRNWGPCPIPERELRDKFLVPFAAAIQEAKLASVMNGYHELDGVPCAGSRRLLTEILRGELGFDGTVVADYYSVACLCTFHRVADSLGEAGARALEAGLDVELPARECYGEPLEQAIATGRIGFEVVDASVRRVLRQKFALGLFERWTVDAGRAPDLYDTAEDRALARRAAQKSIVLLKNEDALLPLSPSVKKIAVIGPNADSIRNLQGDYHYPAHSELTFGPTREPGQTRMGDYNAAMAPGALDRPEDLLAHFTPHVSVLAGIREAVSPTTEVVFARGCELTGEDGSGFEAAIAAAQGADVAVLVVGGRSGILPDCTSGEAVDATRLELTGSQSDLIQAVAATGAPVAVVVVSGRVHVLTDIAEHVRAIVYAWLPGEEGGHAVADVLFGAVNPAGRLPVTLPRATGQVPLYYDHKPSGAVSMFHGNYSDSPVTPLYPFGHGLSYTTFAYDAFDVSPAELAPTGELTVRARVTNTGARAGEEVVQLYVRDRVGSITRPVKELKGFARVALAPGASRMVEFVLPASQLAFHDERMRFVVEPGEVVVMLGASSDDIRHERTVRVTGAIAPMKWTDVQPTRVRVG